VGGCGISPGAASISPGSYCRGLFWLAQVKPRTGGVYPSQGCIVTGGEDGLSLGDGHQLPSPLTPCCEDSLLGGQ